MIDFDEAINVAITNVSRLVAGAKNIVLEGALISSNKDLYEITLSYDIDKNPVPMEKNVESPFVALAALLSKRREFKVFLVDSENGEFKGFRNDKEI